jgi:phytoene synthase
MDRVSAIVDPERRLALAYAPRDRRQALAVLWALDERLGAIVAATREAMLGEIRLAWWRDALGAIAVGAPPGEPLLEALAPVARDHRLAPEALARLTGGWAALLVPMPLERDALTIHARDRGITLFTLSAAILGRSHPGLEDAGASWALIDLAARISDRATADTARALAAEHLAGPERRRWPKPLRALGVLTALARHDCRASSPRTQGAPRRLALAFWAGMTGR